MPIHAEGDVVKIYYNKKNPNKIVEKGIIRSITNIFLIIFVIIGTIIIIYGVL